MKRLIINADDFGLTCDVNRAVIECYKKGSITSTTLIVNASFVEDAVICAKENPGLGVGFHFNLSMGKPISDPRKIPSLVDNKGFFHTRSIFEMKSVLGLINKKDIETEFLAQVNLFQKFGLSMTHIDSHQHIHMQLPVFHVITEYCIQNCVPMRIPYLSYFRNTNIISLKSIKKLLRSNLLRLLIKLDMSRVSIKGLISNDAFYSIFDFFPIPKYIQKDHYAIILDNLKDGVSELMVHPAIVDENLKTMTKITNISQQEHNVLTSFSLNHECQKRGIEFINFNALH
jgi:predicted glycoside hydrolase/deacetylase ChbG (UPF0249 family)